MHQKTMTYEIRAFCPSPSSPRQLQRRWQVTANGSFRGTNITCEKSVGNHYQSVVMKRTWTSRRPVFARLADIELFSPRD